MDMAPRICPWGLQAPSMLPPTSSWPSLLPSKRIRGIYSPVRDLPIGYSSIYHSFGISREYSQICIIRSEIPESIVRYVSSVRKLPKSLFSLYRTFGKFRNAYYSLVSLSGISRWFNLIRISISDTSETVYLIGIYFSEVSDRFIQVV